MLLDHHEHARLTDFGIAQPRDATSLTATGRVLGTESYLAPSSCAASRQVSAPTSTRSAWCLADAARNSGSGSPVWSLIDRLRDREAERRPRSAAIALADLELAEARRPAGEATRPFELYPVVPPARTREPTPVRGEEPALPPVIPPAAIGGGGRPRCADAGLPPVPSPSRSAPLP